MEDLSTVKTCSKCKESCNIENFYTKKKKKKMEPLYVIHGVYYAKWNIIMSI